MSLSQHLAEFLAHREVRGGRAVVACSGGSDSVALLHLLHPLAKQNNLELHVAHADHGLRGDSSTADAHFVSHLAASLRLPFHLARLGLQDGPGLEARGRAHRYDWLRQLAETHAAKWVFTAHHANDQAETVLHHLLRGSHWRGLRGMPSRRRLGSALLLRPLLKVPKARLLRFLEDGSHPFRVDASNADLRFTRNRLRHEFLDPMGPSAIEGLIRLARVARQEYRRLAAAGRLLLAAAESPRVAGTILLRSDAFLGPPRSHLIEMLRQIFQREGWPLAEMNRCRWKLAVAVLRGESAGIDLPGGVRVQGRRSVIQIWRQTRELTTS